MTEQVPPTFLRPCWYFDLDVPQVSEIFKDICYVWEVLSSIPHILEILSKQTSHDQPYMRTWRPSVEGVWIDDKESVFVSPTARVEPGVYIEGSVYIGPGAVVRHGAYVRRNCILLDGSVLGHASEMKNSILLPNAKAPHFAYVGDSILGNRVNLGAGTKLSNVPITSRSGERKPIVLNIDGKEYQTNLTKLGAIIGDDVQVGCNSVMNPGCLIGKRTVVYPGITVRKGLHRPDVILKLCQVTESVDQIR